MLPGFEKFTKTQKLSYFPALNIGEIYYYKNLHNIKFIPKKTDKHKQYKHIKIKNGFLLIRTK